MWPGASKPIIVPAVYILQGVNTEREMGHYNCHLQAQNPVPSGRGTGAIVYSVCRHKLRAANQKGILTCRSEDFLCRAESIRSRHSDRKPDDG